MMAGKHRRRPAPEMANDSSCEGCLKYTNHSRERNAYCNRQPWGERNTQSRERSAHKQHNKAFEGKEELTYLSQSTKEKGSIWKGHANDKFQAKPKEAKDSRLQHFTPWSSTRTLRMLLLPLFTSRGLASTFA
jgi:hypothetical protein